jgi:hypothetical protein
MTVYATSHRGCLQMGTKLLPFRFGDFLLERKVINEAQLLDVLAEHWMSGCRIGESVVRKGYLPAKEIERLAREYENLNTVYV